MDLEGIENVLEQVKVSSISDDRGKLQILDLSGIKFEPKRIYTISNVPEFQSRGLHAHRTTEQVFLSLSGSFELKISDGYVWTSRIVSDNGIGYHLPSGYWRELTEFTSNAICLVLASTVYNSGDYIYDFKDFINWKMSNFHD